MPSASVAWACGSMSTTSTREPSPARQPARLTAVVVFPQPPFWFTIAITRMLGPPADLRPRPPRACARSARASARPDRERRGVGCGLRPGRLLPDLDFAHEARDLEDPFLSRHRVEGRAVLECEHDVARGDEHELAERPRHGR